MARMSPTSSSNEDSSSSSSMPATATDLASSVSFLRSNDVIMGRGAQATEHKGNKDLRRLVRDRYCEYMNTSKHKEKQRITQEIIRAFQGQGGRFLRPVLPPNSPVNVMAESWQVVTDQKIIIDKVKQMLRDVRPETELKRKLRKRKRPGLPTDSVSNESSSYQASQKKAAPRQGPSGPIDRTTNNSPSLPVATRQQSVTRECSQKRESNTLCMEDLALLIGERRQELTNPFVQAGQAARLTSARALFNLHHTPYLGGVTHHGLLLPTDAIGIRSAFPQFSNHIVVPAAASVHPNSSVMTRVAWEERLRQRASAVAFHQGQRLAANVASPPNGI